MDVTYGKPLSEIRSVFKEQDGTPTENSKEIPPPPFTLSSLFLNQPYPPSQSPNYHGHFHLWKPLHQLPPFHDSAVDTSSGKDHHWWRCYSYYFLEYHVTITYRQYRWPSPVWDVKKSVPATLIPIWLRLSPFKQIRQPERYVSSHYVQQRHQKTTHIYKTQTHEKKVHLSKYDCSELSGNAKQCNTQAQSTCTQEKSV